MARVVISDDDHSPVVEILTALLMVLGILAVLGRCTVKYISVRRVSMDDGLIIVGLVFYIAQSVGVYIQAANGLGVPTSSLTDQQVTDQRKAGYSAVILQILSIAFVQLSFSRSCQSLTPKKSDKRIAQALMVLTGCWLLASGLTAIFQCQLPQPWLYPGAGCIDRVKWWSFVAIVNIGIEAALVALPLKIIFGLQTSMSRKFAPVVVFTSRISVIAASALQLHFLTSAVNSADFSLENWKPVVCAQFLQCAGLVVTSMLYIKHLIDNLETGFLRVDNIQQQTSGYGSASSRSRRTTFRHPSAPGTVVRGGRVSSVYVPRDKQSKQATRRGSVSTEIDIEIERWVPKTGKSTIMRTDSWTVESQDKSHDGSTDVPTEVHEDRR